MARRKHRDFDDEDDDDYDFFEEDDEEFEEDLEEVPVKKTPRKRRPARRKDRHARHARNTGQRPHQHEPWKAYPCPTCGRAWEGYGTHVPGQKKQESKFTWIWVLVALVLLVSISVSIIWWGSTISSPYDDDEEPERVIERDVYISEGGYHRIEIAINWGEHVEVSMDITTISGGRFDVYIMNEDDFDFAYDENLSTGRSFSALFAAENIANLNDVAEWDGEYGRVYLVIDNSDIELLTNDAEPTGLIQVHVELEVTEEYPDYYY